MGILMGIYGNFSGKSQIFHFPTFPPSRREGEMGKKDWEFPIEMGMREIADKLCPLCRGPHTLSQCPRWRAC